MHKTRLSEFLPTLFAMQIMKKFQMEAWSENGVEDSLNVAMGWWQNSLAASRGWRLTDPPELKRIIEEATGDVADVWLDQLMTMMMLTHRKGRTIRNRGVLTMKEAVIIAQDSEEMVGAAGEDPLQEEEEAMGEDEGGQGGNEDPINEDPIDLVEDEGDEGEDEDDGMED